MSATTSVKPARERILDAAAAVMRERGIANTTTKAIAAEAGYSEAMLYKHFADKQELFLRILMERVPTMRPRVAAVGWGDLGANLADIVEQLVRYYAEVFPMAISIFGAPELLEQHREGVLRHGGLGPVGPVRMLATFLDAEREARRIRSDADTVAAAQVLVHMVFFLHMNTKSESGWIMLALIFTLVFVAVTLIGSMWVMYHLNVNMMPMTAQDMRNAP